MKRAIIAVALLAMAGCGGGEDLAEEATTTAGVAETTTLTPVAPVTTAPAVLSVDGAVLVMECVSAMADSSSAALLSQFSGTDDSDAIAETCDDAEQRVEIELGLGHELRQLLSDRTDDLRTLTSQYSAGLTPPDSMVTSFDRGYGMWARDVKALLP